MFVSWLPVKSDYLKRFIKAEFSPTGIHKKYCTISLSLSSETITVQSRLSVTKGQAMFGSALSGTGSVDEKRVRIESYAKR